jgi:hypothetical protein
MKNIHLIPTDNYSQLVNSTSKYGGLFLSKYYSPMKDMGDSYQNIYITYDEEIKEGDWFIYRCYKVCKCTGLSQSKQILTDNEIAKHKDYGKPQGLSKKIILTTDQDLDGVQPIDDTFLEWFVRNPSCEEVEVDKNWNYPLDKNWEYQIIIPQEEPKQDLRKYPLTPDECFKQEKLEEAFSRLLYSKYPFHPPQDSGYWKDMFLEGAKWQAERMYSEEDLRKAFSGGRTVYNYKSEWEETYNDDMTSSKFENFDKWLEQNKKK